MNEADITRRRTLSFRQAEGLAELPRQYKKDEIPRTLRTKIWQIIREDIKFQQNAEMAEGLIPSAWVDVCSDYLVEVEESFRDLPMDSESAIEPIFDMIKQGDYGFFYETLQWLIRHKSTPDYIVSGIESLLETERAGVRLVGGDCLIPMTDETERQSLEDALAVANASSRRGMQAHLRNAMLALEKGAYGDCVRESIHAVESVARGIAPEAQTLGEALSKLKRKGLTLHSALEKGFSHIYGYTNDEKGVRHALIDDPISRVDEADAIYMLGACASFAAYLERKAAVIPPPAKGVSETHR